MSTSILVIIPAGSEATKGLASGRASGRKNIATRKGYHDWSPQKADPCSGIKDLKWCYVVMVMIYILCYPPGRFFENVDHIPCNIVFSNV